MPHLTRITRIAVIVALAAAIAACSSTAAAPATAPVAPSVDEAAATEIAGAALAAFNAGDYAGWTRDWDDAMKAAIKESDFLAVRDQLMASLGRYVSLGTPTLSSRTAGTFRWTFPVTFEKASGTFWIAFRDDTTGLRFE
jgi:Protein of unknown function (DUF3887)